MRKNLPVTSKERTFNPNDKLISVTDTRGTIIDCNDHFVEISGFSRDELRGQPHNIIRHPDMPAEAFNVMWSHLKDGKPWMGLVKNRCKNGDFYWVDAYVAPIYDKGRITGYESVRSCPRRDDVERAERLYQRINQGQQARPAVAALLRKTLIPVTLLVAIALMVTGQFMASALFMTACYCVSLYWHWHSTKSLTDSLQDLLRTSFSHDLAVQSYTDDYGASGRIKTAIRSQLAHLGMVLSRVENAAERVARNSETAKQLADRTSQQMEQQQGETIQAAAAMNEMTTTITEVASNVANTAAQAETANQLASEGNTLAVGTQQSMIKLRDTVSHISSSVSEVSEQTERISQAAQLIEQIAEQTNLLALNAAIEAARAGDQGRGFAVVADEVRTLAQRTQESTSEIYNIISELTARARKAVNTAELGVNAANEGVEQVQQSNRTLEGIVEAVEEIANMSGMMATAVEEQSHVAEDINRQVVRISELGTDSFEKADESKKSIAALKSTSDELRELVIRFKL